MSAEKYFVKYNEDPETDFAEVHVYPAVVSSTKDILDNVPLLNSLFGFPASGTELNRRPHNDLSVSTQGARGVCRDEFIKHYSNHPTLLEELSDHSVQDTSYSETYVCHSKTELQELISRLL